MSVGKGGSGGLGGMTGVAGRGGDLLRGRPDLGITAAERTLRRLSLRWCCRVPYGRRPGYAGWLRRVGLCEPSLLLSGAVRELDRVGTGNGGLLVGSRLPMLGLRERA